MRRNMHSSDSPSPSVSPGHQSRLSTLPVHICTHAPSPGSMSFVLPLLPPPIGIRLAGKATFFTPTFLADILGGWAAPGGGGGGPPAASVFSFRAEGGGGGGAASPMTFFPAADPGRCATGRPVGSVIFLAPTFLGMLCDTVASLHMGPTAEGRASLPAASGAVCVYVCVCVG